MRTIGRSTSAAKINVTPLIDVVMCLIVFYLIVGKLASDRAASVDLPSSRIGAEIAAPGVAVITVVSDGQTSRILLDGIETAPADLTLLLRDASERTPGLSVQLRADRSLPFASIQPVLDACRAAGISSLKLVAARDEKGGG